MPIEQLNNVILNSYENLDLVIYRLNNSNGNKIRQHTKYGYMPLPTLLEH